MRVKEADLRKMRSGIFSARNLHDPNYAELAGEIRFLRAGHFSSEKRTPQTPAVSGGDHTSDDEVPA
jgi:hypothetical protein